MFNTVFTLDTTYFDTFSARQSVLVIRQRNGPHKCDKKIKTSRDYFAVAFLTIITIVPSRMNYVENSTCHVVAVASSRRAINHRTGGVRGRVCSFAECSPIYLFFLGAINVGFRRKLHDFMRKSSFYFRRIGILQRVYINRENAVFAVPSEQLVAYNVKCFYLWREFIFLL